MENYFILLELPFDLPESDTKTVRYFTCSALGHNHEGQPYEGKNVVDPVMWLLQQADSSIKAE